MSVFLTDMARPPPNATPFRGPDSNKRSVYADATEDDRPDWLDTTGAIEKRHSSMGLSSNNQPITFITEIGCEIIRKYYRAGLCQTSIARRMGLSGGVLGQCKRRQPEVAAAFEFGKAELEDECSDLLMNMARRGNVIALIYFTKARLGWRDNDQPAEQRPNLVIHMNAPMTDNDWLAMRKAGVNPMQLPGPTLETPEGALGEPEGVLDTTGEDSK